jgi:Lar family restriction alleviation protein
MLRDTGLHDDLGGAGQRIYTTAGQGYEKRKYIRADLEPQPTASNAQLLPCPFCAGQAEIVRHGSRRQSTIIACCDCGCRLESADEGDQYGASWNRRAAHEPSASEPEQFPCPNCGRPARVVRTDENGTRCWHCVEANGLAPPPPASPWKTFQEAVPEQGKPVWWSQDGDKPTMHNGYDFCDRDKGEWCYVVPPPRASQPPFPGLVKVLDPERYGVGYRVSVIFKTEANAAAAVLELDRHTPAEAGITSHSGFGKLTEAVIAEMRWTCSHGNVHERWIATAACGCDRPLLTKQQEQPPNDVIRSRAFWSADRTVLLNAYVGGRDITLMDDNGHIYEPAGEEHRHGPSDQAAEDIEALRMALAQIRDFVEQRCISVVNRVGTCSGTTKESAR